MNFETKNEAAYRMIRKKILSGKYAPGEHLNISALAKQAGTSTIPIREALKQLQTEKLVEFDTHKGARVSAYDPEELRIYYQIRAELEGLAGKLATQRKDDSMLKKMEELLHANDSNSVAQNTRFHECLYQMAQSDKLLSLIRQMWDACYLVSNGFALNRDEPQREKSSQEHRAILEAVRAGDENTAEALIKSHIMSALDVVQTHYRTENNS